MIGRLLAADKAIARLIARRHGPFVATALSRLSNTANKSGLWMVIAVAAASLGGRQGRRAAQRGLLSIGVSSLLTSGLLKRLVPRRRPPVAPNALAIVRRPTSSSFPSGHSASAVAFATATAMEAPAIAAPVAALAAGVAYSRISTGVHYPSDVIVGASIGAAVAVATTKIWPRIDTSPALARPASTRTITEPSPTGLGLTIVANLAAGRSEDSESVDHIQRRLPDATVIKVEDPSNLKQICADAAADSIALGVFGGDGTIGTAAAAALEAGLPMAIFPGGTLNHFARDVGISAVDEAIDAIVSGSLVEVDTGLIDGRIFLNTASFGSYSEFVKTREANEKKIGKWPAAVIALAKMMRSSEPFEVSINGHKRKVWMIFIGNCSYEPAGFIPATRQRLDDGTFDIRIVEGSQRHTLSRLALDLLTGRLSRSKVYTRILTDHLDIDTGRVETMLAADGETFDGNGRFRVEKASERLRLFAPDCDD